MELFISLFVDTEGLPTSKITNKNIIIGESKRKKNMELWKDRKHYILLIATVCACYFNALECDFVFDDMSAIRDNKDLRPTTPLCNIYLNDFWGTPIQKEHSHKSYRPLCVLTFRLNYLMNELNPFSYHLINVMLHALVCILYYRMCMIFLPDPANFLAAILFAVHPIHTEAVTGIVGRAETLSSVFFLLAFLSYTKCCQKWKTIEWFSLVQCIIITIIATLCKEQGITVVAVCCVYEIFIAQRLRIFDIYSIIQSFIVSKSPSQRWLKESLIRLVILVSSALCLLIARLKLMGSQLPVFTKFDNPAAVSETPARQLTYNYLLPVNAWLLLFPYNLCCDWTMGTIPLVESFLDLRNLATLTLYCAVGIMIWRAISSDDEQSNILIISLALIIFPFLPASNLFFPVGFVVAERVLYTPSMGFCLLVAHGWNLLNERLEWKSIMKILLMFLFCIYALKTVLRNYDWRTELTLFQAGLKVNLRNAKLYNNVGHALESKGNFKEALHYFIQAANVQPDDIGAHINVGRTYNNLKMYTEAEQAFWKAKNLLPRPRPGEPYQARIAPSHLNVFLNLANLISRNGTRLEEADALYRQAISMRADYIQAYINRGDILIKLNRTQEAQEVYERALQFDNTNPDIYYNLGVVFLELGKASQALLYFDKALEINPEHEQALMNSAILIQESGNPHLRKIAYDRLYLLLQKGKANERIYFNLGMLAMDDKQMKIAETWFKKAIELREDFRSALFNLALLLSDSHRPLEAVPYLRQLLKHHTDHVKGLILLGDIYINHVKDLDAAQECYLKILQFEPSNIQALHNLCVVYVERGHLVKAERCLTKAISLAPQEDYIQRHLRIVKARISKQQKRLGDASNDLSRKDEGSHTEQTLGNERPLSATLPSKVDFGQNKFAKDTSSEVSLRRSGRNVSTES
ncbi:protein O-mannosyl-transferase Tmtc3-like isoform X2 [Centruroides vittatus]|uniref:protein O-mannosyl-transferase Tmtc3-like isoform X2 n=1 Tax=Centruroides vittatus TaxID=120091 RepID=UPI00350F444A